MIARTYPMAAGVRNASNVLLNADLPWPTVKMADGKDVRLDSSGFSAARASSNRDDRRKVMEAFFGALGSYRRTLGAAMSGNVQGAIFRAQSRHYDSTLQAALDGPNVPTSVYKALVDSVNQHLPSFQRYLKLRKRILKVDELHYYDLYSPLVNEVPLNYTVEQAQANVKAAMAPLGADYVAGLDKAFHDRWIDYYPMTGKQSGAYMNPGAYDLHPYLLLNFNGQVRRHVRDGARARPRDAQLFLRQEPALRHLQLPALRGRSGIDLQRGAAHRPHAQGDHRPEGEAGIPRQLSREREGHGLPADAVRRVRDEDARDGRGRPADHWGGALESSISTSPAKHTTATTPRSASSTTTSPTSGRSSRISTTRSTSTSTRRRSRRRPHSRRKCWPARRMRWRATARSSRVWRIEIIRSIC